MEDNKPQQGNNAQNLNINTEVLKQLDKQDILKLKNIVLELKNKHLQIQSELLKQQHCKYNL